STDFAQASPTLQTEPCVSSYDDHRGRWRRLGMGRGLAGAGQLLFQLVLFACQLRVGAGSQLRFDLDQPAVKRQRAISLSQAHGDLVEPVLQLRMLQQEQAAVALEFAGQVGQVRISQVLDRNVDLDLGAGRVWIEVLDVL